MNPTRVLCLAALLLTLTSAALAAQNPNQPQNPQGPGGGVQPMALPCEGDCEPPPPTDHPPIVTVVTPGTAVNTRTPLTRVTYQPGGTGSYDPIGTVSITWGGVDITSLGRRNSRLFEWEVNGGAHELSPGAGKALVAVVCNLRQNCTTQSVTVTLAASPVSILSVTEMPLEALGRRNVVPMGGGFAIDGTEFVTSVATPPWYSWDTPRSAGLTYSSRQSYPRAVVTATLEFPGSLPSSLTVSLYDGTVLKSSWSQSSPPCITGTHTQRCRIALRADYLTGTGAQVARKWLRIQAQATIGGQVYTSTDSVEAVIVDRRTTPYGSGWWPSGVMRTVTSGNDVILVAADGSATIYRGSNGTYLPPPGDPNTLNSSSLLFLRAGGQITFDGLGRQTEVKGTHPQHRIVYTYVGTTDQLDRITHPATGKYIQFAYSNGRLTTITDPGGRVTTVSIANDRLMSFVPPAPAGQNHSVTFLWSPAVGSNAVLPAGARNALWQWTTLGYANDWPVSVTLPPVADETGASVQPLIRYDAPELRGLGGVVPLDSVLARVTDPRGNWTASTLNRWGQPVLTWDALASLGYNTYSVEGHLLSSQGKTGDSSRVWRRYDSLGRVSGTYRVRGSADTLWLDSLHYGALDRVIRRFDRFANAWTYGYDTFGNQTSAQSPFGDYSLSWYNLTTGRLDSTRVGGVTGATRYYYDPVWGNTSMVVAPDGTTRTWNYFDALGRTDSVRSRVVVRATSASTLMQWRRRTFYRNVANQVDSARMERTANCAAPCNTPAWPAPTDTLLISWARRHVDYLGRDSVRIGPDGSVVEEVALDALGRVVRRYRPAWAGGMAVDSFRYDVAGNLRFQRTRRGHLLETRYDSRNRPVYRDIPTVGTDSLFYLGPSDELTALRVSGYQDPVGGSNPHAAWVYDLSGRLRSDTVQGGRATSYTYDGKERLSQVVDAVGTWRTGFGARGMADTLVTPWADSVAYSFDALGRRLGPVVSTVNAWPFTRTPIWSSRGTLVQLRNDAGGVAPFDAGTHVLADTMPDAAFDSLSPRWDERHVAGGALVSMVDSLRYDGWERVTRVDYLRAGAVAAMDTFTLDRAGNLSVNGTWSFRAGTNQLQATSGCVNLQYDVEGNLVQQTCGSTTRFYTWDALGRLTAVSGDVAAQYAYDALGQRIAKKVNGVVTRFVWRGGHVVFETDNGGTITRSYTWGTGTDDLIAIHEHAAGTHLYVVQDRLRSVRGLVQRTTTRGVWVAAWRYHIYGDSLGGEGGVGFPVRFRWAGAQYDAETGLYYLRNRYYSPAFGRFLSEDPIEFAGGGNLYAYGADPTSGRDPDGLSMRYTPPDIPWNAGCWSSDCSGAWHRGEAWRGFGASALRTQWERSHNYAEYLHNAQLLYWTNVVTQFTLGMTLPLQGLDPMTLPEYERLVDAVDNEVGDYNSTHFGVVSAINGGRFLVDRAGAFTNLNPRTLLGHPGEATLGWALGYGWLSPNIFLPSVPDWYIAHVVVHEFLHLIGTPHGSAMCEEIFRAVPASQTGAAMNQPPLNLGCGR